MRIALLAFPRVQLLDIVGPADVFAEALSRAWEEHVSTP